MKKRGTVAMLAMVLATMGSAAGAADKAGNEALERWIGGTWPLEGKMLDPDYSKAATVTGMSRCGWSPDHIFMICDQSLLVDGKPDRELSVYVFDAESGKFHFYGLSPQGGRPHMTEIDISPDGTHWVYHNTSEIKGKPVQFRTINEFRNPDYIEWWSEYSTDEGQHWTKMGGGSEKRSK